jgi:hypothetical protein
MNANYDGNNRGTNKKGLMIFGLLVLGFLAVGLAAYEISGHMGIEDRFNSAVGVGTDAEEEEAGSGLFGFNIEGNPLYYVIIFAALIVLCLVLCLKFKP